MVYPNPNDSIAYFSTTTTETSSDESCIATKDRKYKCTYTGCFAAFSKSRKFINHVRLHTGERPFACDVPNCTKKYTNSSHLRRHKKFKHENGSERVMCTVEGCSRELVNKWKLKQHIHRCHNPDRKYPFTCGLCGKGYLKRRELQQHSYEHTGKMPFKCDSCEKSFMTVRDCNRHKKVHMNVYPCECGKIFDRWTDLVTHRRDCKDRINLKCTICSKEFRNAQNLKQHQETHVAPEEKEVFTCPKEDCDRVYYHKKNLTHHIKYFHDNTPKPKIPCDYEGCNALLSKMQNYKEHIEKCHLNPKTVKKPRKTRKDKGIAKKSALSELIDLNKIAETQNNTSNETIIHIQ